MPFLGLVHIERPDNGTFFQSNLAEEAETCVGGPDEAIQKSVQKRGLLYVAENPFWQDPRTVDLTTAELEGLDLARPVIFLFP